MLSIQVTFYSEQVVLLLCLLLFSFLACVQNEVLVVSFSPFGRQASITSVVQNGSLHNRMPEDHVGLRYKYGMNNQQTKMPHKFQRVLFYYYHHLIFVLSFISQTGKLLLFNNSTGSGGQETASHLVL